MHLTLGGNYVAGPKQYFCKSILQAQEYNRSQSGPSIFLPEFEHGDGARVEALALCSWEKVGTVDMTQMYIELLPERVDRRESLR